MGRIEEALRRARGEGPGSAVDMGRDPADDPFTSAWGVDEQQPEREVRAEIPMPRPVARGPMAAAPQPMPASVPADRPRPSPGRRSVRLDSQLAMHWPQPFSPEFAPRLVMVPGLDPKVLEEYRRLADALVRRQEEHGISKVLVLGATSGAGASLTAVNLAMTLSGALDRRVLLVDVNIASPKLHEVFQVSARPGLKGVLSGKAPKAAPIEVTSKLALLPWGVADQDSRQLLAAGRLASAVAEAAAPYAWTVLDGGSLDSGRELTAAADTALLVVDPNRTSPEEVDRAVEALGRGRLAGLVLNRADSELSRS